MHSRKSQSFAVLATIALIGGVACSSDDAGPGATSEPASTNEGTPLATVTGGALTPSLPTPTPTISLTPRANATPVAQSAARKLEAEGDLQAALDAYLTMTTQASTTRAEGVLGAGRVLLEMERPTDARSVLEPYVQSVAANEAAPARYMLARAFHALGMLDQSAAQYAQYIQSGRPATPYAYLDRARVMFDANQGSTAAVEAANGLNFTLPAGARNTFIFVLAQSHERAGSFADALRWYQTLYDTAGADQALALSRIAAIKQAQGDAAGATTDQQSILARFPSSTQAKAALEDLTNRGVAVDAYIRGLVYYRQFDHERAATAFNERIRSAPEATASAESYYYLGAIYESKSQNTDAVASYAKAFSLNPQSALADDALWWRARLLEDAESYDTAGTVYAQLVSGYPSSPFAVDAAFRRGMLPYRRNAFRDAASLWAEGQRTFTDPLAKARLALWQGKALLKANDGRAALPILTELAKTDEDDYFGVRAVSLLAGDHGHPKSNVDAKANLTPDFDWGAAEAWLAQRTGRTLTDPANKAWTSDPRWARAQELWLVGRVTQGNTEAFALIESNSRDAMVMYDMARVLERSGQVNLSFYAGQRLLRVLNLNPNAGLPKPLLSLSYPAAFAASVQKYAQTEKISPLLMLAFIRQESLFDPHAESGVGALGLTQVLPTTARTMAARLGVNNFTPDDLFKADLNIRFGANYMAEQLRDFNGSIYGAFAAYNAGPGPAKRWLTNATSDADMYLEAIEFSETQAYIRIVSENYAIYRYIYGGESVPNLPED